MQTELVPQSNEINKSRLWWLAPIAVMAIQLFSYVPQLTAGYKFNQFNPHDCALYLSLGKSISEGRGFTRSLDAATYIPHAHWPPGLPVMLAPCLAASDTLLPAHIMIMLTALCSTLVFWRLAEPFVGPALALAACCLLAFSPLYDQMATVVMGELPSLLFFLLGLLALHRWYATGLKLNWWAVAAVASLGFGMLVKPVLLPIFPAFFIWALFCRPGGLPRRKVAVRAAALLFVAALPWALWGVRSALVHAPGYDGFSQFDAITKENLGDQPFGLAHYLTNIAENIRWFVASRSMDIFAGSAWFAKKYLNMPPHPLVTGAVLLAVCAVGVRSLLQFRRLGLLLLTAVMYAGMMLINRNGGAFRYWLLWNPPALILVLDAIVALARWARRRLPVLERVPATAARATAAFVLIAGATAVLAADHAWRPVGGGEQWVAFGDICREAGRLCPPNAVLLSRCPTAARFISGLRAMPTPQDYKAVDGAAEPSRPVYAIIPIVPDVAEWSTEPDVLSLPVRNEPVTGNKFYKLVPLCGNGRPSPTTQASQP